MIAAVSLASHHFPVTGIINTGLSSSEPSFANEKYNFSVLRDPAVRDCFADDVQRNMSELQSSGAATLDARWLGIKAAVDVACKAHVPLFEKNEKKPWISQATLDLIDLRTRAHISQDWKLEKKLRKQVHSSARRDRGKWLENLVQKGSWDSIKQLRRGKRTQQARLKDAAGTIVESDMRAETLAAHLETIQWRVRPTSAVPICSTALRPPLPIRQDAFDHAELRKAIKSLRSGRAFKTGDVSIECLKAFADQAGSSFQWLLDFCNECWMKKQVPSDWSLASVTMLYKKGDAAECANYRPICILTVASKVYAAMLKNRIINGGALEHLWKPQFGFRPGCCTEDAMYCARRRIELACAQRGGKVMLLALDWKQAFDSVNVEALLCALECYGIPKDILAMIAGMLHHRNFCVNDCNCKSDARSQRSGISQGCTLSPLLFIIAMTVLMHDAVFSLSGSAKSAYEAGELADVVYADDTLLIGASSAHMTEYLNAICTAGRDLGMELHWGKFQLLPVRCDPHIIAQDGTEIPVNTRLDYLGTTLSGDGFCDNEVSRRIGMAKANFNCLKKVWGHTALPWQRKLAIYASIVESNLLYGLAGVCLTVAQQRRRNGFQNRCLRSVLGIQVSFISRISNAEVLRKSGHTIATDLLLVRQLHILGKVLRAPDDSPLRVPSLIPGTTHPATERYVRNVGRPRKEWIRDVMGQAVRLFGSAGLVEELARQTDSWKAAVRSKLLP